MAQWGPVITLIIALSFIIVAAILVALYLKDSKKLFASLTYTAAVCVTLTIVFGCFFIGVYIIFAALAVLMLRRKEKYIPWAVWGSAVGTMGFSALILFLGSMSYFITMDILLIPSIIICTVLLIAVTIVRACLKKKLFTNNRESEIATEINEFVAYRKGAKGYVIAGNIFAALSYIFGVIALRMIIFPLDYEIEGFSWVTGVLIFIESSAPLAMIGWFILKKARESCDIDSTLSNVLYIWCIVPAIIGVIIITLIIVTLMASSSGKSTKKIVKIKDPENGETLELEFWGNMNETCEDKHGRKWKTDNGGKLWRKTI